MYSTRSVFWRQRQQWKEWENGKKERKRMTERMEKKWKAKQINKTKGVLVYLPVFQLLLQHGMK